MSCSSICIPRVFYTVTAPFIKDTFEKTFKYGKVERVDMVKKTDKKGLDFYKVFVHFQSWNTTPEIMEIRKELDNEKVIREEYMDDTGQTRWWLFSRSRVVKPEDKETTVVVKKKNLDPKWNTQTMMENLIARFEEMVAKYNVLEAAHEETKKRVEELETQLLCSRMSEAPEGTTDKKDTMSQEKTTTKRWGDCSSDSESEEESEDESDNEEEEED